MNRDNPLRKNFDFELPDELEEAIDEFFVFFRTRKIGRLSSGKY